MTSRKSVPARTGRPRKDPPPGAAARIAVLAARGVEIIGIAAALAVSRDTLNRWFEEDASLKEAFTVGREMERQELHGALYSIAMNRKLEPRDRAIAAMFLLKSRHGYREGADIAPPGPTVVINLPGAKSVEAFTVENSGKA